MMNCQCLHSQLLMEGRGLSDSRSVLLATKRASCLLALARILSTFNESST